MKPFNITDTFLALDGPTHASPLPVTDDFWPALMSGRLGRFSRLVSSFSYTADWPSWERHPAGEEMVCLLEGEVELHLERDDWRDTLVLDKPGDYALVPPNTWHTAKVRKPSRLFFITPGEGTENRPA
jgi:hypothetical protein